MSVAVETWPNSFFLAELLVFLQESLPSFMDATQLDQDAGQRVSPALFVKQQLLLGGDARAHVHISPKSNKVSGKAAPVELAEDDCAPVAVKTDQFASRAHFYQQLVSSRRISSHGKQTFERGRLLLMFQCPTLDLSCAQV